MSSSTNYNKYSSNVVKLLKGSIVLEEAYNILNEKIENYISEANGK